MEIEDRGIGIPPGTLAAHNERLANPPEFDLADSDQLGLLVVSLLAARHGIKVTLRGSPYGGISAVVLMPHRLALEADAESLPFAAAERAVAGGPEGDRESAVSRGDHGSAGAAGTGHRLRCQARGQQRLTGNDRLPGTAPDPDSGAGPD